MLVNIKVYLHLRLGAKLSSLKKIVQIEMLQKLLLLRPEWKKGWKNSILAMVFSQFLRWKLGTIKKSIKLVGQKESVKRFQFF